MTTKQSIISQIRAAADAAGKNREGFLAELQGAIEEIPGARVSLYVMGPHVAREDLPKAVGRLERKGSAVRNKTGSPEQIQSALRDATLHGVGSVDEIAAEQVMRALEAFASKG